MSKLADLEPREPIQRYEHEALGDLLRIDTKPSHRFTGNRRDSVDGAGWGFLFVAVDDHARLAFTAMHSDERKDSAVRFLRDAVVYYGKLGVTVKRLLTDNGSAFRIRAVTPRLPGAGYCQQFTRAHRPQTNGKAERFMQRTRALARWQHHYNWHPRTRASVASHPALDFQRQERTP